MTRADLLRRQTKPTAANGCRPKGYAGLGIGQSPSGRRQALNPGPGLIGPKRA